jgi:hypothetical protein
MKITIALFLITLLMFGCVHFRAVPPWVEEMKAIEKKYDEENAIIEQEERMRGFRINSWTGEIEVWHDGQWKILYIKKDSENE